MLIDCRVIKTLWLEVRDWISDLCEKDYVLSDETKILGDTINKIFATIIIMHVKRAIFSSKINGCIPTIH